MMRAYVDIDRYRQLSYVGDTQLIYKWEVYALGQQSDMCSQRPVFAIVEAGPHNYAVVSRKNIPLTTEKEASRDDQAV